MFTAEERDRVRDRLLELARTDPDITAAAITGSHAVGAGDRWSDIDLAFAVAGGLDAALARWTRLLYQNFGARHHWDLPSGPAIYRVFLLPDWLEVDIGFTPEAGFGPRGPRWRLVFGGAAPPPAGPATAAEPLPEAGDLVGLAWHHALHGRVCIERHRAWQAAYWIAALRDEVIALACLRLGLPTAYAKGAHLLPAALTAPLEATLVRSLDETELCRALHAAMDALAGELERTDPVLAARLVPMLAELRGPGGGGRHDPASTTLGQ